MALTAEQISQQKKEAEELLGAEPEQLGFAKALFAGQFNTPWLFPYPELKADVKPVVEDAVAQVRRFVEQSLDAAAVDRQADIPPAVIYQELERRFGARGPHAHGKPATVRAAKRSRPRSR